MVCALSSSVDTCSFLSYQECLMDDLLRHHFLGMHLDGGVGISPGTRMNVDKDNYKLDLILESTCHRSGVSNSNLQTLSTREMFASLSPLSFYVIEERDIFIEFCIFPLSV